MDFFENLKGTNRKNSSSNKGPTAVDLCFNCGKKGHWYFLIIFWMFRKDFKGILKFFL